MLKKSVNRKKELYGNYTMETVCMCMHTYLIALASVHLYRRYICVYV